MGKPFNPADYNLVANPSLPETNSPWRFWGLMMGCAVVIAVSWQYFTPEIRVSRPILTFTPEKITVTSEVVNRTATPATLLIRFKLGTRGPGPDDKSKRFASGAQQDVWVTIPPRSTAHAVGNFPKGFVVVYAESQIIQQQ